MAEEKVVMMRVRATRQGSFNGRRREGDEFDIPKKLFSKQWMEEVKPDAKGGGKAGGQKGKTSTAQSKGQNTEAQSTEGQKAEGEASADDLA